MPTTTRRRTTRIVLTLLQIVVMLSYVMSPFSAFADEPTPDPDQPATSETPIPSEAPADVPTEIATASPATTEEPAPATPAPVPATPAPAPATPAPVEAPTVAPAPALPAGSVPFIVSFAPGTTEARQAQVIADAGVTDESSIPQLAMHGVLLHDGLVSDEAAALRANADVLRVEQDRTREAGAVPSDSDFGSQWALAQVGWTDLYGTVAPAGAATIAVLDTGIDGSHWDLDQVVRSGTSLLDGGNGLTDPNGHGTAMAGIVAAETDNAFGVAGTAFAGVSLLPVTVLDANGLGQDSDIIAGVVYAADAGADVILMAFSNPGYSPALQAALDYAWSKGAVLVAAVGNDGSTSATYPAGDRGVVGVAATDSTDALAAGSNSGAAAFLAAPGVDILTTALGGHFGSVSGSSASAAQVAGAAGLLAALDPGASNGTIVGRLARNADPAASAGLGNGRLNLARAAVDTSTDAIQPAGAAPLATGGPIVGPYVAAGTVNGATIETRNAACTTAQTSFTSGSTVCANVVATIQGGGTTAWRIQWYTPAVDPATGTPAKDTGYTESNGTATSTKNETFTPTTAGTWTIVVCKTSNAGSCSSGNQIRTATFTVTGNVAPAIATTNASRTVSEGATSLNSGTWGDANSADNVTLTASVGTVTKAGANATGTWNWSFGTSDGPSQSQTVTITADDGTTTTSTTFALTVTNVAPSATFNAPASIDEGSNIALSLSSPSDPSSVDTATAFTYAFDCGTGSGFDVFSSTSTASCVTTNDANRTVKGQVKDKDGGVSEYSASVTVANVAPVVSAGADATIAEGDTFSQSGSFADSGSDTWSASVDYGDGTPVAALALSGQTFTLSHTYAQDGAYTVTVTVHDDDTSGSDTVLVTVDNVGPVVSAGADTTIDEGGTFSGSGSFADPGADSWSATVDYGDGSGSQALGLNLDKTFSLSHVYADNDSYTVTVTVSDDDTSGSDTLLVTVANVAPDYTPPANQSSLEGQAKSFNLGSFTDPGADSPWEVAVAWGDGSANTVLSQATPATIAAQTHAYADDGSYTVTVTVSEENGDGPGSDSGTFQVVVANVAPAVGGTFLSIDPVTRIVSANATWTDPGADTYAAKFEYFIDGSTTPAATRTVTPTPSSTRSASDNLTQLPPGCYTLTMKVTVTDDDGGVGIGSGSTANATVAVYAAIFQAPIKDNERNIAKYGNVVPVKVQLTNPCTGALITQPNLIITIVQGNVSDDTIDDTPNLVAESVSSADTGNQMRLSGSGYLYNFSTKQLKAGNDYTIRIRVGDAGGPIIAKALFQPKK